MAAKRTLKVTTPGKKPPLQRIPSDDFAMFVDGVEYRPHADEWVEVYPIVTYRSMKVMDQFVDLSNRFAAINPENPEEATEAAALLNQQFDEVCSVVAERIGAWSWTDVRGRELPSPAEQPDVLLDLSSEELLYLMTIARGITSEGKAGASPNGRAG